VRGRRLAILTLAVSVSGCAAKGFKPPTGPGQATSDAAPLFSAWSRACADIHTLTAEAALSGRVERGRVRGRLHMGLTSTGGVRLEAVAPFGPPLFTLAGDRDRATLWLPRDGQVLRDAPPAAIVDALAGVDLSPSDLLAVVTGCLGAGDAAVRSEQFATLIRVTTRTGVEIWWSRRATPPALVAIIRGDLLIEYLRFDGELPAMLRLTRHTTSGPTLADLRLSLSQREVNAPLEPAAFTVDVPADAKPISLDDLRRAGLFGSR